MEPTDKETDRRFAEASEAKVHGDLKRSRANNETKEKRQ